MIYVNEQYTQALASPRREVIGGATIKGSTATFSVRHTDDLINFKLERTGESGKYFGFGVAHKLTIEILDKDRKRNISDFVSARVDLGANGLGRYTIVPPLYISQEETSRDETTNKITIIAYDRLCDTNAKTINDYSGLLDSVNSAETVAEVAQLLAPLVATGVAISGSTVGWGMPIKDAINIEGTETIRELLDDIAEVTQTIYYIDYTNDLVFKDIGAGTIGTIDNTQYFELTSGTPILLEGIASTTELGENIVAGNADGAVQALNDNAFLTLREDAAEWLNAFIDDAAGVALTPFDCSWRGNFLYEIGDAFEIIGKNNEPIVAYLYNDTLTYDGGLSQQTKLEAVANSTTNATPTTLGEAIKETFARVDKANKRIELLVSDADSMANTLATLQLDANTINAAVQKLEQTMVESADGMAESMAQLTSRVEAAVTAQDVSIAIKSELDNGVEKVVTSTGFTFDEEGLKISKSGTDLNTQITEDGMEVRNGDGAVLTANSVGVDAANLHATTYLIIGTNSRLEDYDTNRTGCFWIGG